MTAAPLDLYSFVEGATLVSMAAAKVSLARLGLDPGIVHRLEQHNMRCAEDVLLRQPLDLVETLDVSLVKAEGIIRWAPAPLLPL